MVLSLKRWLGKVAIVTGANSGIGEATSKRLAQEGMIVVGVDKNIEKIEVNAKSLADATGKLYAVKADLTQEDQILKAFKWTSKNVGPVAVLINNAGIFLESSTINGATEDWKATLDVNLLALCIAAREAIKIMREHSIDGHIVNICSINGHKVIPGMHMYTASKYAVKAVTETLRLELNALKLKIKVGCVSPGTVYTAISRSFLQAEEAKGNVFPFLNPEDIADAIVYALSTPAHVQIQELLIRPVGEFV